MNDSPEKILLYTDGSEDAALDAPVMVSLANKAGSELHVAHIWHTAVPFAPPSWFKRLDEEIAHAEKARGAVTQAHLRKRHTAEEVINPSDEIDADLIVAGAVMGLDSAERKILEGLFDDIVHHARSPALMTSQRPGAVARTGDYAE